LASDSSNRFSLLIGIILAQFVHDQLRVKAHGAVATMEAGVVVVGWKYIQIGSTWIGITDLELAQKRKSRVPTRSSCQPIDGFTDVRTGSISSDTNCEYNRR
jgi:hypothetical protein